MAALLDNARTADYIEVTNADLVNGLLTISLLKEIPEAMEPKSIAINQSKIVDKVVRAALPNLAE